jgi:hypothetical protein
LFDLLPIASSITILLPAAVPAYVLPIQNCYIGADKQASGSRNHSPSSPPFEIEGEFCLKSGRGRLQAKPSKAKIVPVNGQWIGLQESKPVAIKPENILEG